VIVVNGSVASLKASLKLGKKKCSSISLKDSVHHTFKKDLKFHVIKILTGCNGSMPVIPAT
jgi:hypothetical protein